MNTNKEWRTRKCERCLRQPDVTLQNDENQRDVEDGHERHEEQAQSRNLAGRDISNHPQRQEHPDGSPPCGLCCQCQENPEHDVREPPGDRRRTNHLFTLYVNQFGRRTVYAVVTMRMPIPNAFVLVIAMAPVMAAAQQFLSAPQGAPVDPNTRYEAVSIRPANDDSGQMRIQMTPGRFEATNVPIGVMLRQALQKPDYQMVGAPGWVNTERYSIRATGSDSLPPAAISVMLQNLLKDRFQLATRLETREQPIFHLVVARSDGRLGPDLKATPAECQATIAERRAAEKAGRGGLPPLPAFPGPNEPLPCGFGRIAVGIAAGSGRTIAQILPTLSDLLGRPVIDKTGLAGLYDFSLKYAPELGRTAGAFGPMPGAPPPPVDPDVPSLPAALQEQLGLKLEGARGPVEVIVIDRFEKPTLD